MKVLFLSNNLPITNPLYQWLCVVEGADNIILWDEMITADLFEVALYGIEFIVSYNYKYIIRNDVLSMFPDRIINLHTSMLPWNRGASPNLWSFIEDTPKGVTIHFIDDGLDTGNILIQKQLFFNEHEETLETSYQKLHTAIQTLFYEHWENIKNGEIQSKKQFSCHTRKETAAIITKYDIKWNESIASTKKRLLLERK